VSWGRRRRRHRDVGDEARGLDDVRRRERDARIDAARALVADDDRHLRVRIAHAPLAYLMVHTSPVVVRHCEMLEPPPRRGETRVVATPTGSAGRWHLDVATADRPGLLAAFTGVLHEVGIDVEQAVAATWPDGAALQSFVVALDHTPDTTALERAFATALDAPVNPRPVASARVEFDHTASPLFTACQVHAVDEPGLLHTIAAAFAAADVDIHAARVTTVDGTAVDHFDLSDRAGRKLDPARQAAIVANLIANQLDPVPQST
jgi:[protein-PII] uridylyltransferase